MWPFGQDGNLCTSSMHTKVPGLCSFRFQFTLAPRSPWTAMHPEVIWISMGTLDWAPSCVVVDQLMNWSRVRVMQSVPVSISSSSTCCWQARSILTWSPTVKLAWNGLGTARHSHKKNKFQIENPNSVQKPCHSPWPSGAPGINNFKS